ncbi:DUF4145 domain-containing protein [Mycobacterium gordonae]|nr:DUF4145 domain-containing protein [Mycobacterium gordonae]
MKKTNHSYIESNGITLQYSLHGDPIHDFEWDESYSIIQCMGCDKVAFLIEYSGLDTEVYDDERDYFYRQVTYTVYPEEPQKVPLSLKAMPIKQFTNVPDFVNGVYVEVVNAYNSDSTILGAVGLRTIVEAICKDAKVVDGLVYDDNGNFKTDKKNQPIRSESLLGKINGLVEAGLITKKQSDVLHQVRELGNYAVHEIEMPARKTVKVGIEIVSNILLNMYELDNLSISPKKGAL